MGTNMPTTPPRSSITNANSTNTPYTHKKSSAFQSSLFTLNTSRAAALDDIGRTIPEVPFQYLEKNILPVLRPKLDVPKVVQRLKAAQVISNDRWVHFEVNPSDDPALENVVFAKLDDIIKSIIVHSQDLTDAAIGVQYINRPHEEPLCDYIEKGNQPDGYLLLKNRLETTATRCYWRDICTAAEFKKRNTDSNLKDDVNKICWNMHQMMHEDARRRFVYAFTIEDTTMRVWFASRSDMIVSKPFDFMKDHAKVVHFFLSQLYATDLELGIDVTMTLVAAEKGKKPVYDISVQASANESIVYRTVDLIDQAHASAIRGRGTRVWEVYALNDPKQTGVLKDSWVDSDRTREGKVLEHVANDVKPEDRDLFDACFLTVLAQGDVVVDGVVDNTRDLLTRGVKPPSDHTFNLRVPSSHPLPADGQVADGLKVEEVHGAPVDYSPKTRHRIVFKQKCTPLYKEKSLSSVFQHLSLVVLALQIMHEGHTGPGWVHRDISPGNILIDGNGQTKLADLEYAKSLSDTTVHNVRTGTLNYMAVEVDFGAYAFTRDTSAEVEATAGIDSIGVRAKVRARLAGKPVQQSPFSRPPSNLRRRQHVDFRHNPLHDLESVWWMALDFLINRERSLLFAIATRSTESATWDLTLTPVEREFAQSVFYNKTERQAAFTTDGLRLQNALDAVPEPIKFIGEQLLSLRNALKKAYVDVENAEGISSIGKGACQEAMYDLFYTIFDTISGQITSNIGVIEVKVLAPSPSKVERYNQKAINALALRGVAGRPNVDQRQGSRSVASGSKRKIEQGEAFEQSKKPKA